MRIGVVAGLLLIFIGIIIIIAPSQEAYEVPYSELVQTPHLVPYEEKVPQTVVTEEVSIIEYPYKEPKTQRILEEEISTVPARAYLTISFTIDISGKEACRVTGTVEETAGYDINFYVFDQKNFNAWKEGKSYLAYVALEKVSSKTSYEFYVDHTDNYIWVFDNRYSLFTNKVPKVSAELTCHVVVTKTTTTTVTKTSTTYIPVTKYRTEIISVYTEKTRTEYKTVFFKWAPAGALLFFTGAMVTIIGATYVKPSMPPEKLTPVITTPETVVKRQCLQCGRDLSSFPLDIKNCPYCGTILMPPPRTCPQCGKDLSSMPSDIKNCPYCGNPIT
ncbi:MAG: zinc ribbon domain-containing protein [Thermoproteota archaeon]